MDGIEISIDDDFSKSLEYLLKSLILDFLDDNQLFGDAFFQNSEICSSSSSVAPSQAYCSSLDATKEYQQTNVGDLEGSLEEITPNLSIDEPRQQEQIPAREPSTNVIIENDDKQNNEYSQYTTDDPFKFAEAKSPHPQQHIIKLIYNDNEQFLPPMPPRILTSYPNMNTCMGSLYQEKMGLSACYGGQGQQLFSNGILPMRMPAPNLMPTMMPMLVRKTNYQNNSLRPYNMHDTFLPYGYKPTNLQVLKNRLQQQQPHNNSSSVMFSGTVPDISTPQTSTLKKKMKRSKDTNVREKEEILPSKSSMSARKHLQIADLGLEEDLRRMTAQNRWQASTSNQDCNNVEVAINDGDLFEFFNFLDQSNCNNSLEEPALDPLDFLILDG